MLCNTCKHCGAELNENSHFCAECGQKVESEVIKEENISKADDGVVDESNACEQTAECNQNMETEVMQEEIVNESKTCKQCGAELKENDVFCAGCGQKVESEVIKEEIIPKADDAVVSNNITCNASFEKTSETVPSQVKKENKVKQTTKISSGKRIAVAFVSFIFSIIFFLLSVATFGLIMFRNTFNEKLISDMFKEVSFFKMDVSNFMKTDNEKDDFIENKDDDVVVSDIIYNMCNQEMLDRYNIDEESMKKILEETDADAFVSGKIEDYIVDLYKNDGSGKIEGQEIVDFIEENSDTIYDITGYEFTEKDYEEIETKSEEFLDKISLDDIEKKYNINFSLIRFLTSYYLIGILIFLMVVIAAILILINSLVKGNAMRYIGIPLLNLSIFMMVSGLVGMILNIRFQLGDFISMVIKRISMFMIISASIIIFIEIIYMIVHKIIKYSLNRRLNK